MASNPPSTSDRRISGGSRPAASSSAAATGPSTPQRPISSTHHGSPTLYRSDDEHVILELGTRYLRIGLAGEAQPRATIPFSPSRTRRVGDFREFLPSHTTPSPLRLSTAHWGRDHELWQADTRDAPDSGLVEDKLERALREAYAVHLLQDPKTRKVTAVLPAVLPTAHLEAVLSVLHRDLQVPGVSLVPSSVTAVTAAGLRSGLVVDVGWRETVVTAVYELREVEERRSTRAVKMATLHMARLLERHHGRDAQWKGDLEEKLGGSAGDDGGEEAVEDGQQAADGEEEEEERLRVAFADAEEAVVRVAWCQSAAEVAEKRRESRPAPGRQISGSWPADSISEAGTTPQDTPALRSAGRWEAPVRTPDELPMSAFCLPVESAFFANGRAETVLDDHELPLHVLLYNTLVALPPDVRGTCVSRIVLTGGGSGIPGLKARVFEELEALVAMHGFDPVRGAAAEKHRAKQAEVAQKRRQQAQADAVRYPPNSAGLPAGETPSPIPAGMVMPERHPIDERLARDAAKSGGGKGVTGIVRAVETLGSWAGASLMVSSRVKAMVDVNAEEYNSSGMLSAVTAKTADISIGKAKSFTTSRESKGWTLGLWTTSLSG